MAVPALPADDQDPDSNISRNHASHTHTHPYSPAAAQSTTAGITSSDSDNDADNDTDLHNTAHLADEDEAGDIMGVSMSRAQTRMKARSTPAEEKNRVMERNGGYSESIPDLVQSDGLYLSDVLSEKVGPKKSVPPPSPLPQQQQQQESQPAPGQGQGHGKEVTYAEDARPKDASRTSLTRSILGGIPRPRALSGDTMANLSLKKFLPDLGSLTRRSSLSFRSNSPSLTNSPRPRSLTVKSPPSSRLPPGKRITDAPQPMSPPAKSSTPRRKSESSVDRGTGADGTDEPISELQSLGGGGPAPKHSFTRRPSAVNNASGAPPLLRRTSSDHSLYLRASSTASSLDHRPQFEHVHSQVNSRFKAIKDSLQDSSSRLLSMPSFNLQDIRSEWGYKPFFNDVAQRKGNDYADMEEESLSAQEEKEKERQQKIQGNTLHPVLAEAMSELTGDLVVMGGYRGSILRSAKPPRRQLWVPMKVGLNLRKVDLEVGFDAADEETMHERVIPSGVLSHVGPVDICRRLMKHLYKCENAVKGDLRVWDYGYDWRLSPHLLSQRLINYLEGLPCNAPDVPREKRGAYVIAHSLGGLIARHAVNQRPELFAGVIYAGVPQHCVNILGPLRNGDDVLLSSRVLTAQVNFSFRTSFALLPEDGHCFINKRTKEEYPVDFFSPQTWDEYRLSPCINLALPTLAARNFIDNLPLLGKRFTNSRPNSLDETDPSSPSMREYKAELSSSDSNYQNNNPNSGTEQANPPHDYEHHKLAKPKGAMGGLVGPTTHPRGAAHPKATATTTLPRDQAMTYLTGTLSQTAKFKSELAHNASHQENNRYPPFAVVFGKSVPTVYGARVWSREHIKHQDAYDDLAFAAGDGVCLASAAMLPPGYKVIRDGLVKTDRGHVGLLGDLEGIGQCLRALVRGRREGVGYGPPEEVKPSSRPGPGLEQTGEAIGPLSEGSPGSVSGTGTMLGPENWLGENDPPVPENFVDGSAVVGKDTAPAPGSGSGSTVSAATPTSAGATIPSMPQTSTHTPTTDITPTSTATSPQSHPSTTTENATPTPA